MNNNLNRKCYQDEPEKKKRKKTILKVIKPNLDALLTPVEPTTITKQILRKIYQKPSQQNRNPESTQKHQDARGTEQEKER